MTRLARRVVVVAAVTGALLTVGAAPAAADAVRNREYWLADYGIEAAWAVTRGEGVTIAIIDTGVDGGHRDLAGAVVDGADFTGSGLGGAPVGSTHGTLVASLAAGRGHGSGDGVIGAAPAASVLSLSIAFGENVDSDSQVADAISWAVDHGADVINMSFTRETLDWPESWDEAFLKAAEADVIMVAAAGNRGSGGASVAAPATIPGVLVVAGVDREGRASNRASSQGITIGVAAPSEQLIGATRGGGYSSWSGTSGAAPIVAGVAALVRAAHPDLDAGEVINRILRTARPAGAAGVDPLYGYGLVDAAAAVSDAPVEAADGNPMGDLAEWVVLNRRAEAPPVESGGGSLPAPHLAPITEPADPITALVPSIDQLREVGVPLLLFVAFGLSAVVLVGAAFRHAKAVRRRG